MRAGKSVLLVVGGPKREREAGARLDMAVKNLPNVAANR